MKLGSRFFALVICALAVGFFATSARADVTYSFTGINSGLGGDNASVGFQYTTTSFINSLTELTASQLTSCTHCLVSSNPTVYMAPVTFLGDGVAFVDSNQVISAFLFGSSAFTSPGTYFSTGDLGTSSGKLVVSTVAVPEPGSIFLALMGVAILGLLIWRKKPEVGLSGRFEFC
jgi:hypothetical protein